LESDGEHLLAAFSDEDEDDIETLDDDRLAEKV